MSDSSNNNACTCSYTGDLEKELFAAASTSEKGSPNNSYKTQVSLSGKSSSASSRVTVERVERENTMVGTLRYE